MEIEREGSIGNETHLFAVGWGVALPIFHGVIGRGAVLHRVTMFRGNGGFIAIGGGEFALGTARRGPFLPGSGRFVIRAVYDARSETQGGEAHRGIIR